MHIYFPHISDSRISQNRVHKFICKIIANCINLQFAIKILKNHAFRSFRPILGSIGLLDVRLPQKEVIYTDGRTDRQTDRQKDRQTDGQTSRTTTIGSSFEKIKKNKNMCMLCFLYLVDFNKFFILKKFTSVSSIIDNNHYFYIQCIILCY